MTGDKSKTRLIPVVETGHRMGETHHNARLTDAQVEAIRTAWEAGEDGAGPKIGYRQLGRQYGVSRTTIRDIVTMRRRNTWADRYKRVDKPGL